MEMIRIVNLISRKVIVISQNSICNNLLFLKNYIYVCNSIDDFPIYINQILSNYNFYYDHIFSRLNEDNYNNYIKINLDKFIAHSSH